MRYLVSLFWMIAIVLIIIFVAVNSHSIELNYYIGKANIYLPLLLCVSIILGALFGILAMLPTWLRSKNDLRKAKKSLVAAHHELQRFRDTVHSNSSLGDA